jgi:hypothetical protein
MKSNSLAWQQKSDTRPWIPSHGKTRVLEKAVYRTGDVFAGRNTTALGAYIRPLLHHKRQLS